MTNPTIRLGSKGAYVLALQFRLNQHRATVTPLNCDGDFGPLTRSAVVAFQTRSRLAADGVVGPLSWAALDQGQTALVIHDHNLTRIPQPTPTTCWAASTAVMKRSTVAAVRAATPAAMIASDGGLLNGSGGNDGLTMGQAYGRIHGLNCHAPASWTSGGMTGLVRRSPVMFDMLWSVSGYITRTNIAGQYVGSPGHMIVVSAVVSDGTFNGGNTFLRVLDPWPPHVGRDTWVNYTTWMQEVPTRTYRLFDRV